MQVLAWVGATISLSTSCTEKETWRVTNCSAVQRHQFTEYIMLFAVVLMGLFRASVLEFYSANKN